MLISTPTLNQAAVIQKVFADVDERYAELPHKFWNNFLVRRLTSKRFESFIAFIEVPQFRFGCEYFHGCTRVQYALANDALYLGFVGGDGCRVINGSLQPPGFFMLGPGAESDAAFRGAITYHTILLRGAVLDRLLTAGSTARGIRRWLVPSLHRPHVNKLDGRRLQHLLTDLTGLMALDTVALLQRPAMLQLAQDDLLAAIRLILTSAEPDAAAETVSVAPRRRALALAAEELIWSQPNRALSLAAICDTLNTSERTLQLAFQEQFGVGFRAFLRAVRLHQARAALVRSSDRVTIATIAMEYGFWHLGRFARYYQQLFGCTPSETQRLAKARASVRVF